MMMDSPTAAHLFTVVVLLISALPPVMILYVPLSPTPPLPQLFQARLLTLCTHDDMFSGKQFSKRFLVPAARANLRKGAQLHYRPNSTQTSNPIKTSSTWPARNPKLFTSLVVAVGVLIAAQGNIKPSKSEVPKYASSKQMELVSFIPPLAMLH